jgi:BolA family transcriptional regulator, general stress-responsive regulator
MLLLSLVSNEKKIKTKLEKEYLPIHLNLINESHLHRGHGHGHEGNDSHFKLVLVSDIFEGKSRVQRQQLIHKTLAEELAGPVHALAMKLLSPKEWDALPSENRKF